MPIAATKTPKLLAMVLSVLAFVAGMLWVQTQPLLPAPLPFMVMGGIGLLLVMCSFRLNKHWLRQAAWVCVAVSGAVLWAGWLAQQRLADALPDAMQGQDVQITGRISTMPERTERGWRFEFAPDAASTKEGVPHHLLLSWYATPYRQTAQAIDVPPLHAGDQWALSVRLKRPHGNFNPHGFDYEAWLFERNIRATGYVRAAGSNRLLASGEWIPSAVVERLRENIRTHFETRLEEAPYAGVLVALAVGDQQSINANQWTLFSRTGITHLISISGLHITMLAGLAYALVSLLWRRCGSLSIYLMSRCPAQRAAIIASVLAAYAYCLLAGFGIPAQRTLCMLTVVAIALWSNRNLAARHVLSLALLVVLLFDPWAVLAAGFWLSFGAVALLFYIGGGRLGEPHWLLAWGRAQWAMTIGLIPLLLCMFQQFSLVSPLANAVAIPVVSFVVTPLALLAAIPGLEILLLPAHAVLALLMQLMEWLSALPYAVWQQHSPPAWAIAMALAGSVWLLMPRGFPQRALGLLTFLPLLLLPAMRPAAGDSWVTVLDVGQGLAVHIQTATHDLLFDSGPAFSEDADSGNRIILPYLRAAGVVSLDGMIISHADRDHSGGAESVIDGMPVAWMKTSVSFDDRLSAAPVVQQPCRSDDAWDWDGVRFELLHPTEADYAGEAKKTNDMSCVLKVTTASGSMLLTADIEARSERILISRENQRIHADVLLVPHHGSATSSTPEFIAAVGAPHVIFTVGYLNHFHHPHPEVMARYVDSGAKVSRTDGDGALTVRYSKGSPIDIIAERKAHGHYWHGL